MSRELELVAGRLVPFTRLCREPGPSGVVSPAAPAHCHWQGGAHATRDRHRRPPDRSREVVIWENGLSRHEGRVEMTRTALEGFGRQLLRRGEVVVEATGNAMAVSRVLSPHVARVVIANPRAG